MIKHGKIFSFDQVGPQARAQLMPVRKYITKGVADSKESISLTVETCDARGAKQFNNECCVLAKLIDRKLKPKAVSVARGITYIVVNGVAVRLVNNNAARLAVDQFDKNGLVFHRPVTFNAPAKSQAMGIERPKMKTKKSNATKKRLKTMKARKQARIVRAVSGGAVMRK